MPAGGAALLEPRGPTSLHAGLPAAPAAGVGTALSSCPAHEHSARIRPGRQVSQADTRHGHRAFKTHALLSPDSRPRICVQIILYTSLCSLQASYLVCVHCKEILHLKNLSVGKQRAAQSMAAAGRQTWQETLAYHAEKTCVEQIQQSGRLLCRMTRQQHRWPCLHR